MTRFFTLASCIGLSAFIAGSQTVETGKGLYQGLCTGCHGEDGSGGGHGPGFLDVRSSRATTREAVRDLILTGIADRGMPAFRIPREQADLLAGHVMALKQPSSGVVNDVAGNPGEGERFFSGKGNCASCHMVRGRGGVLGPDLSNVGRERSKGQIEQILRDPETALATAAGRGGRGAMPYRAVTVRLRDGQTLRGIAKNESTFDIQLLGLDGKLHLLRKDQVASVVREKSLMPRLDATPEETTESCRLSKRVGDRPEYDDEAGKR